MRVIAIKEGYDNVKYREVGEEFDMPEGSKGKWFKPVEAPKAKKGGKEDAADIT